MLGGHVCPFSIEGERGERRGEGGTVNRTCDMTTTDRHRERWQVRSSEGARQETKKLTVLDKQNFVHMADV
jgi:hypothetical protein